MALTPRLDLRQSQSLVLTPQLQQAIKLLQMANLELGAFVEQELERNPLLEPGRDDAEMPEDRHADDAYEMPGFEAADGVFAADAGMTGAGAPAGGDSPLDADYSNVFDDAPVDAAYAPSGSGLALPSGGGQSWDEEGEGFESRLSAEPDLRTHLSDQMLIVLSEPADRLIAAHLIDLVDEAGYMTADRAELAAELGTDEQEIERILAVLRGLEPTGVFARDLADCLALQLVERDRYDPAMQALVENLPLLARKDLAALKRLCGVDDEDLAEMIGEVRALDPRPGLAFGNSAEQPVIPDVFVRRAQAGGWTVELNAETLPRVLVNQQYYAELASKTGRGKDRQYLSECLSTANWLVRALDQRAKTILKVSSEIVRQQEAFLTHGVRHLKPLILRDIAEVISMHESTVSRVTSGKYMATNRGMFELKFFFTSSIQSSDGGAAHSSEAVRDRIKALIDSESSDAILSDDAIVDQLRSEGIDIARRTVAKYRESMRIGSSVQRRRAKLLSV